MSTLEPSLPLPAEEPTAAPRPLGLAERFESALQRAGEWLNPILVKECRQALKSRQFVITFALLLIGGWIWSIAGIAMIGPNAYFSFNGPDMFYGYFLVLAFSLVVVVPFGAFRSLAAEYEDRTFELVSITTLHPRQIVAGKLGSAVMQMIVYFSALSPCLAFTYLLRGIDVVTIGFTLGYLLLASLALTIVALLLSTIAREKVWQGLVMVGLIIALLNAFWVCCAAGAGILSGDILRIDLAEFWVAHAAGATAYGSYFVLFFLASAAQLTFASDNRSTPLRVTMLAQFVLLAGWMAGIAAHLKQQSQVSANFFEMIFAFVLLSGLHWFAMGSLMVLEQPNLSERVKRRLPQSFLGRVFLTWFNPGPGTGYLFAVSNLLVAGLVGLTAIAWFDWQGLVPTWGGGAGGWSTRAVHFTILGVSYAIFYLGLGKLTVSWLRWHLPLGFVSGLAVQFLILFFGTLVPLVIYGMSDMRGDGYTLLQATNPFWTLAEALQTRTLPSDFDTVSLLVPALAAILFMANLPGVAREVRHVRIAPPKRVAEES